MGLFNKLAGLFGRNQEGPVVGGVEDFMSLIRVYYQAAVAARLGITNIAMLPDLRDFKRTLKIATLRGKLGVAEKARCESMLEDIYGLKKPFFDEIDKSIKKNCRKMQDVQTYLFMFQGFSNDIMTLAATTMSWKARIPARWKKTLYAAVEETVHDIMTKNTWKDDGTYKGCITIRQYQKSLGYSEAWMTEYVFNLLLLAKKEPKKKEADEK